MIAYHIQTKKIGQKTKQQKSSNDIRRLCMVYDSQHAYPHKTQPPNQPTNQTDKNIIKRNTASPDGRRVAVCVGGWACKPSGTVSLYFPAVYQLHRRLCQIGLEFGNCRTVEAMSAIYFFHVICVSNCNLPCSTLYIVRATVSRKKYGQTNGHNECFEILCAIYCRDGMEQMKHTLNSVISTSIMSLLPLISETLGNKYSQFKSHSLMSHFSPLYHGFLSLMQATKEVDPHPCIAPCVNMWSVTFFFFCHFAYVTLPMKANWSGPHQRR